MRTEHIVLIILVGILLYFMYNNSYSERYAVVLANDTYPSHCTECCKQEDCSTCVNCGLCVNKGTYKCVPGDVNGPFIHTECDVWNYGSKSINDYYTYPYYKYSSDYMYPWDDVVEEDDKKEDGDNDKLKEKVNIIRDSISQML